MASKEVTCEVWLESNKDYTCLSPADVQIVTGCVHEHIAHTDICNYHLADLTQPFCRFCKDLPQEGHMCSLSVKIIKYYGPRKMDDHSMEK